MNEPYDIIQTASLTEKSTLLSEKENKYVFRVSPRANKIQIKNALERLFQNGVRAGIGLFWTSAFRNFFRVSNFGFRVCKFYGAEEFSSTHPDAPVQVASGF